MASRLYEIKVGELKKLLKRAYLTGDRDSKLILGAPGIGKSEMLKELAAELAKELGKEFVEYDDSVADTILARPEDYFVLVDVRLTEVEPSDLIGLPREVNGYVKYKPLLWAVVLSKCAGILFLDELTNVQRLDVQTVMYKLMLDKKVGFTKLNKDVMVIAAGNEPEHSSVATELPAPVINRVDVYYARVAGVDEWKDWMDEKFGDEWDKRVYAYVKARPQHFLMKPERAETLEQFATPRRWTSLALVTKGMNVDNEMMDYIAYSKVGSEAAAGFLSFIRVPVMKFEDLLKEPEKWHELKEESKYMTMVLAIAKIEEMIDAGKIKEMVGFIKELLDNDREFLSIMVAMMSKGTRLKFAMLAPRVPELKGFVEYIKSVRNRLIGDE